MSDLETYRAAVVACALARQVLRQHDLAGLIRAIDHAETVGPVLDPTSYRERGDAMREDRELLRCALTLRDCFPERS